MILDDNINNIERVKNLLDSSSIASDFVTSICSSHIASGSFRAVFEYALDDRYVVKIEPGNNRCNITEHAIWQEVKGLKGNLAWVKKWFAPVGWISHNGRIMTMRKTMPASKKHKPTQVPKFLWDVKSDNFGWYNGNYVCHDYGQLYNMIAYGKSMKKIEWD